MKTALYAGSFDPLTYGHMDIIEASSKIFDKVIVGVSFNFSKEGFLTIEDRINLIHQSVNFNNVEVTTYSGLTTDFAKRTGASVLIRGIRNILDFEYEMQLAQNNKNLCPEIETFFIPTKAEHSYISSSAVREMLTYDGDISNMVPLPVYKFFR